MLNIGCKRITLGKSFYKVYIIIVLQIKKLDMFLCRFANPIFGLAFLIAPGESSQNQNELTALMTVFYINRTLYVSFDQAS